MATVERPQRIECYTLKCRGLSSEELQELYQALAEEFPEHRPAFRNPFPPQFHAHAIHEILLHVTQGGLLAYLGQKGD
jgi:hypothetical protein